MNRTRKQYPSNRRKSLKKRCINFHKPRPQPHCVDENNKENINPRDEQASEYGQRQTLAQIPLNLPVQDLEGQSSETKPVAILSPTTDVLQPSRAHENDTLQGRRIIDIRHFISSLQELDNHGALTDCKFSDMRVISEVRTGFESTIKMQCSMCNVVRTVTTHETNAINSMMTMGILNIGSGHAHLEQICASCEIPSMSYATFQREEKKIGRYCLGKCCCQRNVESCQRRTSVSRGSRRGQ